MHPPLITTLYSLVAELHHPSLSCYKIFSTLINRLTYYDMGVISPLGLELYCPMVELCWYYCWIESSKQQLYCWRAVR